MIADSVRMSAYEEALRRSITPDSVVLDIGAGPGIMSLLAAKIGARRVVAIEPNPLVRVGARLAVENGLADRIIFVQGLSEQIVLEEKADVVVADLRAALPNVASHIEAIVDARRRLMKRGGTLIPARDTVFAAPVQAEEAYSKLVTPWKDDPFGLRMKGAVDALLNRGTARLTSFDRLLGGGQPIASLEYLTVESPNIDATVELQVDETGVVHGLSLWFETELVHGVGFSTAPDQEDTVYGRVFLPMTEPLEVEEGDRIHASIKATFDKDSHIWVWRGRVVAPDGSKRASFTSSNAFFNPRSPNVREVVRNDCVSTVSVDGGIVREVLLGIDGRQRFGDLAAKIFVDHPDRFEYEVDAVNFVRDVVEKFGDVTLLIDD